MKKNRIHTIQRQNASVAQYNVVWDSPSANAHGSMPLGNGDIGINAWVEPEGDLVFYVSKTDAWDENGRLCKIGRVRVMFDSALSTTNGFRQELKLDDGIIEITDGKKRIELWVDANQPVVCMDINSGTPVSCRAEVELWRQRERPFVDDEDGYSGKKLESVTPPVMVLPDIVETSKVPNTVVWYHRNTHSLAPFCLKNQNLDALQGRFPDPLLNRTFGAALSGGNFVLDGTQAIQSAKPGKTHRLRLPVLAAITDTPDAWLAKLETIRESSRTEHVKWWHAFWDRSWIFIDGNETLTRGYVLQRFMNACAGRGGAPIKFNGSIFTVEATPGASPDSPAGNPDWRRWGGNYWLQNTRLAYWPMLEAGDFDLMDAWFRMYKDALPLCEARIETYYKFKHAAQFPETMYFWGLPNNNDYGFGNKAPEPQNTYIRRYWSGSLELIAVMLDRYDFTQDEKFARETLVPLADPLISFLDQYWQKHDANGKRRLDPAQSLETWHTAVNPTPEIAGFHFLLPRLLALPESVTTEPQRAQWKKLLNELPPVPIAEGNGKKRLDPAVEFSERKNVENPELYAVFPYRLYGVGRPDLDVARNTYHARGFRHNHGWCQDSIHAACLGLGDEASRLVDARAKAINEAYRFPVMWGPNFDWIPDQDHGNNILTTLQAMLLQSVGDTIYLLPAWPKGWDVSFKLHAPRNTTVEGKVVAGKLADLKVIPESRRMDVIVKELI